MLSNIQGTPAQFTDDALRDLHDAARIRKIYRLEASKKGGEATIQSSQQLGREAETFVVGSIALKGS